MARAKAKKAAGKAKKKLGKRSLKQQPGFDITPPSALGQGYSVFTGEGWSTAVSGPSTDSEGEILVNCKICQSSEELAGVLDVSASVSAGFSSIASVDAKLSFMYSLNLTKYSVSVVVHSKQVTGKKRFTSVNLKVPPPTTNDQLRDFFANYGDAYISEIAKGGEYFAVYAFYSETRDEQVSVMAGLSAAGIVEGVPVKGDLQAKISMALKTATTRTYFDQRILGVKKAELPEPSKLVDFALKFGNLDKDAPVILGMKWQGYEHAVGMSSYFKPVATNRKIFLELVQKQTLVQRLLNQAQGIRDTYEFYGGYTDQKLNNTIAAAPQDIKAIDAQIDRYLDDPVANYSTVASMRLPSLDNGLPLVDYEVKYHTIGKSGGKAPDKDVNPGTVVEQRLSIRRVAFNADKKVYKMKITYESEDVGKSTVEVGGGGGKDKGTDLAPKDRIEQMFGSYKDYVDNIYIEAKSGAYLQVGEEAGQPSPWRVPSGHFTIALQAKSDGKRLNSLTVAYAQFKPAKWAPA
jgi:hypothetical protein